MNQAEAESWPGVFRLFLQPSSFSLHPFWRGYTMSSGLLALAAVAALSATTTDEARRVAAKIDEYIAQGYEKAKAKPAPLADDAAFFRRMSLDVAGRIPAVSDVRKFLSDTSPDRRARATERMLDS